MSDLSFREKSAWGTLAAITLVGTLYFSSAWNLWRAEQLDAPVMLKLAFGYTIFLVLAVVAHHAIIAIVSPAEGKDERDRLIDLRAGAVSGAVLGFGVITVVIQIVLESLFGGVLISAPILIANALLLCVLISTIVELVLKLVYYRRGI